MPQSFIPEHFYGKGYKTLKLNDVYEAFKQAKAQLMACQSSTPLGQTDGGANGYCHQAMGAQSERSRIIGVSIIWISRFGFYPYFYTSKFAIFFLDRTNYFL